MNEDEKRVVAKMIAIYCKSKHGSSGVLCEECRALREYAFRRLEKCRFGDEKPTCNSCPVHCYRPDMRTRVKEVMRFSGPKMIFHHPVDAIVHLYREYRRGHFRKENR